MSAPNSEAGAANSAVKYFTIHGHFYQPPRENPWLGSIEIQESAAPDHDWNDRIAKQCYGPNGRSRILCGQGRIEDIVNNYEYMSFNFGPTLLSWLEKYQPETYSHILEGDARSCKRLNGHGNAIAQVYNHVIMPLANGRDRKTQIEWGIQDFSHRFGRKPEGMWLAETAINMDTVVDLIDCGIKFTILAPTQAQAFRSLKGGEWEDASHNNIDTSRPYRIHAVDAAGNKIREGCLDVFFYHGSLSSAVGFEHLLTHAETYFSRIKQAFNPDSISDQLISVATDGESYGHHEPFGDMCAAYIYRHLAPESEIIPVNYAWYLSTHEPQFEVLLKNVHGEGTAWSCAHGVGRWYRSCSCGGPEHWNQEWRGPMRKAFDLLRDRIAPVYVREVAKLSDVEPWELRNQYGDHLLSSYQEKKNFILQTLKEEYRDDNSVRLMTSLLEMQKFSLYMYTSCAWFFADIDGLEPEQNLKYARRAIELAGNFMPADALEKDFCTILKQAQSNQVPENGEQIYRRKCLSQIPAFARVIAEAVLAPEFQPLDQCLAAYSFRLNFHAVKTGSGWFHTEVHYQHKETLEEDDWQAIHYNDNNGEQTCFIFHDDSALDNHSIDEIITWSQAKIFHAFKNCWQIKLTDLYADGLKKVSDSLIRHSFDAICSDFLDFPVKHGMLMGLLAQNRVAIPDYIVVPLKMSLSARANHMLNQVIKYHQYIDIEEARKIGGLANDYHITLATEWIAPEFRYSLNQLVKRMSEKASLADVQRTTYLITIADLLHIDIDKTHLENLAFPLYQKYVSGIRMGMDIYENLTPFFGWLNFNVEIEIKAEVNV